MFWVILLAACIVAVTILALIDSKKPAKYPPGTHEILLNLYIYLVFNLFDVRSVMVSIIGKFTNSKEFAINARLPSFGVAQIIRGVWTDCGAAPGPEFGGHCDKHGGYSRGVHPRGVHRQTGWLFLSFTDVR